jgi:hypothetical protein
MRHRNAGLLLALILTAASAPQAVAVTLFADPVRQLRVPGLIDMQRWTSPTGRELLVLLDSRGDLLLLDLAEREPWKTATLLDGNGRDARYQTSGSGSLQFRDINHDGWDDAVAAANDIHILFGFPDGSFSPPYAPGLDGEDQVIVEDLDADGYRDVAVPAYDGNLLLEYRRGRGDGRFGALAAVRLPGVSSYVGHGDWNGDGRVDLLGRRENGHELVVLWNDGQGVFHEGPVTDLGQASLDRLDFVPITTDDVADLVLIRRMGTDPLERTLEVWRGIGDGTFEILATSPLTGMPAAFLCDTKGDGRPELVSHEGEVFVGGIDAGGHLETIEPLGSTGGRGALFRGDFDGDGLEDLLTGGTDALRLLLGADRSRITLDAPEAIGDDGPVLADLTGDGRAEVIGWSNSYSYHDEGISFECTWGYRSWSVHDGFGPLVSFEDTVRVRAVRPADTDGDGDTDLVFSVERFGLGSDDRMLWINDGMGSFTRTPSWPAFEGSRDEVFVDVGHDGRDELVRISEEDDTVLQLWGYASNGEPLLLQSIHHTDRIASFRPYDLDGDIYTDLLVIGREEFLTPYSGGADLSFTRLEPEPVPVSNAIPGDWVGDDRLDLLYTDYRRVLILDRDAAGEWRIERELEFGDGFIDLEIIPDVNSDGRPDLMVRFNDYDAGFHFRVSLLLSDPVRGLSDPVAVSLPSEVQNAVVGDVDADGQPDVVVLDYQGRAHLRRGLMPPSYGLSRMESEVDGWRVELTWDLGTLPPGEMVLSRQREAFNPDPPIELTRASVDVVNGGFQDASIGSPGDYVYQLSHRDVDGFVRTVAAARVTVSPPPAPFRLLAVAPSPGPGPFRFAYEASMPTRVVIEVISVTGRRVRRHDFGVIPVSKGTLDWDGRDDEGRPLSSGVYFVREPMTGATSRLVVVR